jgi:hypothetical protein
VEAMGGTISALSTPGEGSTFRVVLPHQPAPAVAEQSVAGDAGPLVAPDGPPTEPVASAGTARREGPS